MSAKERATPNKREYHVYEYVVGMFSKCVCVLCDDIYLNYFSFIFTFFFCLIFSHLFISIYFDLFMHILLYYYHFFPHSFYIEIIATQNSVFCL